MLTLGEESNAVWLAILTLLVGIALAFIVRGTIALLTRYLKKNAGGMAGSVVPALQVANRFVFWTMIAMALLGFLSTVGGEQPSEILQTLLEFMPTLAIGGLIIGFGHLVGTTLRDILKRTLATSQYTPYLAGSAYVVCIGLGLIIGIQHIGIDVWYIATLTIAVISIVLASIGIAFALGARYHIANLIAYRTLQDLHPGERVKIGEFTGTVINVTRTSIVLNTPEGTAHIPPSMAAQVAFVRLNDDE